MLSAIRKRLTYANVAMTLALVFAMSGGAYAASKYLITSTKQISPKVLKALKGANGKNGAAGLLGPAGATGPGGPAGPAGAAAIGETGPGGKEGPPGKNGTNGKEGTEGSPWTAGGTLPSEKTETGTWSFGAGKEGPVLATISFALPLKTALGGAEVHYLEAAQKTTECPGTNAKPQASPGSLCVYQTMASGVLGAPGVIQDASATINGILTPGAAVSGAIVLFQRKETEEPIVYGTWAVTEK